MLAGLAEWATTMLDPVARRAGDPAWVPRTLDELPTLSARLGLVVEDFELTATQALVLYAHRASGPCVLKLAPDAPGLAREAATLAAWAPRTPRVLATAPGFVLLERVQRFEPAAPNALGQAARTLAALHTPGVPIPPAPLSFADRLTWLTGPEPPAWCVPLLAELATLAAAETEWECSRGGTGIAHGDAAAKNLARRHDSQLVVLDPLACRAPLGFDLGYLVWSWTQHVAPGAGIEPITAAVAHSLHADPAWVLRWADAVAVLWASVGWPPARAHLETRGRV